MMLDRRPHATLVAYLRLLVATLVILAGGVGQPFAQTNSFLQPTTVPTQGLNTAENVRYLRTPPSAAVVIQTGIVGQNGQSIELCKIYPGLKIQMLPDTAYFAAMVDADLHGHSFVDPDRQRGGMPLYNAISFVASGTCDANGLVHLGDFPALPWIVTAKLPQKLPGTNGSRIVVHTILLANATTNVSFSKKDVVSSTDTISAGLPFNFSAVRTAFAGLPAPSAEGLPAEQALSAIDRGDMQGAAIATMHYIDACVRNKMCSDSLKLSMQQEFESNRPWFEFFGTLATAGLAGEFVAGGAVATAATEEEVGLSRIGRLFRAAEGEVSGSRQVGRDVNVSSVDLTDWSGTKTLTAPENALEHWTKHMGEFPEYRDAKQYVQAAQDFVNNPPAGTLLKMRPNGDKLFYNPSTNTFVAANADGAPKTMFRPSNGVGYWNIP